MIPAELVALLLSPPDRWTLVKRFVAHWHEPLREGQGYGASELDAAERRLGFPLPVALREWYQLAGQRKDLTARQDRLLSPSVLKAEHGMLFFHVENQGCCLWGVRREDVGHENPPVFMRDDAGQVVREAG